MLDLKGAHEWVVTTKLGSSDVRPGTTPTVTRNCRLYAGEMAMSAFVLGAAFYGVFTVNRWTFSIFLFLQVRRAFRFPFNPRTPGTLPPLYGQPPGDYIVAGMQISLTGGRAAHVSQLPDPPVLCCHRAWCSWHSASTWWTVEACWAAAWTLATPSSPARRYTPRPQTAVQLLTSDPPA